jgi:predicted RNase H-like nuclease (RuvC/YqgF family)
MQNELLEVIKKNLPEQTASEMKEFVRQAEENKKALLRMQEQLDLRQKENKALEDTNTRLSNENFELRKKLVDIETKERHLNSREILLDKRELRQEIQELKALAANRRADDLKELASIVFRNKTLVTMETRDIPIKTKMYSSYYDNQTGRTTYDVCGEDITTGIETKKTRVSEE